ncbi:hypothetical protein TEA_027913 [Camellia sinensis var. sinensis]|uniref:P-type ATPase C-terminal domain-containing protein n=1 Tax=Camellia sinensis var. sinensis TaxID=542762 RepID=A0A4S4DHJ9_CAMSN|nr:hypothetical protein TEA_027913 [Camellia sinensis var. sinensis]
MAAASLFLHRRHYLFLHHCNSLSSANPLPSLLSSLPRRALWNRLIFLPFGLPFQFADAGDGLQAIVVFAITIHAYAFEKSEMEEMSMVALSGCIWLQAFVVTLETNSYTIFQLLAIWGNLAGFYIINWIVSSLPSSGMYTIMFRLCRQPSYWITMFVRMGPVLALKYFRYTYRPSKINILQQAERMGGHILSLGNIEPSIIAQPNNRNPVYEPLLSDSPNNTKSFGSGAQFDVFQSQIRLSSSYSRNCKDN